MDLRQRLNNAELLLFDLDGTLIDFSPEVFYTDYIQLAYRHFHDIMVFADFRALLLKATFDSMKAMDGSRFFLDVFLDEFTPNVPLSRDEVNARFQSFYSSSYNELEAMIRPYSVAKELLELIRNKGIHVVLATNPVFPAIAVEKRIVWGGLSPKYFDYITHAENSTYVKPQREYFQQLLEMFSCSPRKTIMIGNDLETDIPASQLGITTILVPTHVENKNQSELRPDFEASLADLLKAMN